VRIDPLNDDEICFVDDMLMKYGNDDSILDTSELDGFFTAIVSGPEMILPSQWMPVIWGGAGNEPEWESETEFKRFFALITQLMNYNATMLMTTPELFEALFIENEIEGKVYRNVDEWCEGYLRGVQLSSEQWLQLPKDLIQEQLSVMHIFGSDEHNDYLEQLSDDGIEALQDKIEPAARMLHAYFLKQRGGDRPQTVARTNQQALKIVPATAPPQVGRNDPCICGSGKKYKKCCLTL
jgi:uncharacterized protein